MIYQNLKNCWIKREGREITELDGKECEKKDREPNEPYRKYLEKKDREREDRSNESYLTYDSSLNYFSH